MKPRVLSKNSAFDQALKQLNQAQRQAVETIDGPLLVLAGPGTGKTQIVACRIAQILKQTDSQPESILALTFTDSGVKALRRRLLELIGSVAYRLPIYTFHAFCADVIRSSPESFLSGPQLQPLSDLERFNLLKEIIDKHGTTTLRPLNAPDLYLPAITDALQNLKREGVLPGDFKQLIDGVTQELEAIRSKQSAGEKISKTKLAELENQHKKLTELMEIYYLYQKGINDQGRFDFEDMINYVTTALERDEILRLTLQEKYQYFLVDEFQDTNSAQLKLLELLTSFWGPRANIFAVGDPNQSIYRFQGASFENLLRFLEQFPQAKVIGLTQNYRSQQDILDAAFGLITANRQLKFAGVSSRLQLIAKTESHSPIKLAEFSHGLAEQYFIAAEIKKLLKAGVSPGEIAVIYKKNQEAAELIPLLNHFKIPYQIAGGGNLLEDPQVQLLIRLLRLICLVNKGSEDGVMVFEFLSLPFNKIEAVDLLKLNRLAAKKRLSVVDLLSNNLHRQLELEDPSRLHSVLEKLSSWVKASSHQSLPQFVEQVIFESGFLAHLESLPESFIALSRLKGFLDFINTLVGQQTLDLAGLIDRLELMSVNHLNLPEPELGHLPDRVVLTTAHKTKGLEWDYCFIYKNIDGQWGNPWRRELIKLPPGILKFSPRGQDSQEVNEDERRLFYVALTRARRQVYLTHATRYPHSSKEAIPSLFLAQLPQSKLKRLKVKDESKKAMTAIFSQISPLKPVNLKEEEALQLLISQELQLSASALTTYQQCGYKFKLKYLYKIPEAQTPALLYGSAVHRALELFFRRLAKDKVNPGLKTLLTLYHSELERQPLESTEKQRRHHEGEQVLTAYYQKHEDEFPQALFVERWFGGQFKPILFNGIPLAGKIDRIDIVDPVNNLVKVVDYKTGRPKTLNQVLGKTADSDGSQLTQLLFYKLLTDQDADFRHTVVELELDFIEGPYRDQAFKRPKIKINNEEIESLKTSLETAFQEIKSLKFDRTNDHQVCQRCPFLQHCWPEGLPAFSPVQLELIN